MDDIKKNYTLQNGDCSFNISITNKIREDILIVLSLRF